MKLGSFCSGYGGLDLAVELFYNAETVWWSDIDKASQQVMATRFPTATPVGDLTKLNPHDLEPVDIVAAGFPCQPFSTAGLRKGNDDERAIFQWIGDACSILRPERIVLENVQGILTKGGPSVIATLTSMGYDCRWGLVRASDAYAPHRRARWICVAYPADTDSASSKAWGDPRRDSERLREKLMGHPTLATNSSRKRHGGRQDSGVVGKLDSRTESEGAERERSREESEHRDAPTSNSNFERSQRHREHGLRAASEEKDLAWGDYLGAIRRWEAASGRVAPSPVLNGKLSEYFVEWMMGLPFGWVTEVHEKRTPALRLLGNGVVPQQVLLGLQLLEPHQFCPCHSLRYCPHSWAKGVSDELQRQLHH